MNRVGSAGLALIGELWMLARKMKLALKGLEVGTTPMLVPAVSSRINLPLQELLQTISGIVDGPILISAYDYYHLTKKQTQGRKKKQKLDNLLNSFPELIFLDSGGYECNKNQEVSDIGLYKPDNLEWNKDCHSRVISEWPNEKPTVLISYDNPSERKPITEQIEEANNLFQGKDIFLKEILIKPETEKATRIKSEEIIKNLYSFSSFDILGFTEKELGYSILDRMTSIAKIRMAMDKGGMEIPIHIFGSLDTITTPLYYLAGADIFDGLSWLRFMFDNESTLYIDSFGPKFYGAHENIYKIWIQSLYKNYNYLRRLKLNLEIFQSKKDFNVFGPNANFFEKTYNDFIEKVEVI